MKKSKVSSLVAITAGTALLISCATTSNVSNKTSKSDSESLIEVEETVPEKVRKEPKPIVVQNTSNQKETEFKALLSSIELKVVSGQNTKKVIYPGQDFASSYVLLVTDANGPKADVEITVSYPASRSNDTISYGSVQLKTDAEGKITFKPEPSSIAVKDKVTFYPTPVSSTPAIVQEAYNAAVTSPYVIKSNYTKWPGGILYVYDFNENGKPTTNNFTMLQNLRNAGINAGNCPVSDTSYFNKSVNDLYKACIDMTYGEIKNSASFLIMGSFKHAEPVVENADSATVTMTCEVTCVDMKSCNVLYKTSATETATDKTKWNAEQKAKKALADKVSEAIIYGM